MNEGKDRDAQGLEEGPASVREPAPGETSLDAEHRRMRWASRRGMLELDLVLEPFVATAYPDLAEDDRRRYRELMGCQDQELFAWFLKREVPGDPELASIVEKILLHARSRGPRGG